MVQWEQLVSGFPPTRRPGRGRPNQIHAGLKDSYATARGLKGVFACRGGVAYHAAGVSRVASLSYLRTAVRNPSPLWPNSLFCIGITRKNEDGGRIIVPAEQSDFSVTTQEFMRDLFLADELDAFVRSNEGAFLETSLSEHLNKLLRERGVVCEHVIRRCGIERVYGHQIFSGIRKPSRDKVIQLAFGFALGVEEAQELLRVAGKSALYAKLKRDAVLLYCLNHAVGFLDAQAILSEMNLPLLGREGRYE